MVSQTGVWGRSTHSPEAMWVWGQSLQPLGNFVEKKTIAILMPLDHNLHVFRVILKNIDFEHMKASWKNQIV